VGLGGRQSKRGGKSSTECVKSRRGKGIKYITVPEKKPKVNKVPNSCTIKAGGEDRTGEITPREKKTRQRRKNDR